MIEASQCSRCGTKLPTDAVGGHCLKCLLELGLGRAEQDSPVEQTGERIGQYKLLRQIGEGGCGIVYLAEQEQPMRREVALKIIKLGMDTKQVIARFEAEQQALALMEHPNIATVFDAGATEKGRPYFVMELVRGSRITEYCDDNTLPIRKRLRIFLQVCQAVQHAHQKGVIHRDLKPSNILVMEQNGQAVPKIIDFGIAKATTGQRLTDKTLFTAFEKFIGTPAYMSPEQASLGVDIDTRSDIYSLGVLLYELLCGQQPFDAATLHKAAFEEVLSIIRKTEPERPAARIAKLSEKDAAEVAARRQTEVTELPGRLRGDLDWIVMKALEKDRSRRYETASSLAMDIERYLKYEPIAARPPSRSYILKKFAARNKVAVIVVGAVIVSLLLGLGASAWMFRQPGEAKPMLKPELPASRLISGWWKPSWTPDGSAMLLCFEASDELALYNLQTKAVKIIVSSGKDCNVSPDGKYIAYSRASASDPSVEEVCVCDINGSSQSPLAIGGYPAWSSDSKQVIYHDRSANHMQAIDITLPGSKPTMFYDNPLSWYPAVSKDLGQIAFGPSEGLVVVDRQSGTELVRIPVENARGLAMDFSPDGSMVAYGGYDDDQAGLWVLDLKSRKKITVIKGAFTGPAWSPDGSTLAFDHRDGPLREVWVVSVKDVRRLLSGEQ